MLPVLLGTGLIAAVGGAALGVFAYVNAATVYTDGDTIRIPVGAARPGEILWQEPASLAEPMLSPGDDYEPRVAWDGLTVYFSRGRAGRNADLYVAQRTPDGWTEPQPLAELNTPADELGPCPSYDGQTLYFYSDRAGGLGGYDLWLTHRGPSGWLPAIPAGPQVNSPFNEYGPSVSPDGRTLYFASNRPPSVETPATPRDAWPATLREDLLRRTYDLYEAAVTPGGFGEARPLAALNTPANEGAPCASPVGDFLYFASDRPDGIGGFDLYRARILRRQIHPPDSLGPQINTAANELDPALAQLGFALYFSSDRAAELDGVEVSLAAGTGVTSTTRRYHLYYAQAREVFRETGPRNAVDWAAVWQRLWPYLLWLLVALLALLLLWKLIGDMRDKRLSLLARCLMASMMAHALLLFLFSFWRVSAVLVDALRAGNPIRVGLVSTAAEPLAEQVAGSWAAVAVPQPRLPPIARAGLVEEPHSAPLPAPPRTERALSLEAPPRDPAPAAADAPLVLDAPEIPALAVAPALEPPSSLRPVVALPAADRPATAEPPPPQDPVLQPATIGRAAPTLAPSPTQDDTIDLDLPPADIHAPEFGGVTLRAAAAARDAALPSDRTTAVPVAALAPLPPAGPTSEPLALPAEERVVSSGAAERAGEPLGPQPGETDPPDAPRYAGPTGAAKLATLDPAPPTPAAPLAATSAPAWTPIAVADARVSSAPAPQVPVPLPALGPTSRPVDLALPEVEESAVFADSRQRPERAADAEYSLSADVSGGPKTDDRTAIRRPALAIRGSVRDARSGKPLPGATVQLDAGGAAPFELESDDRGRFALALEDVPDSFVVSAMSRGYVPQSTGLTAGQLSGRNVAIEFSLTPSSQDVVVVEPAPELHHLGNDRFEGRINSRFEKRAEGRSIRFTFRIADDALAGARRTARLTALTRGVQCEHPVRINGELLPSGLAESPADGSFGPAKIEFDAGLLRAGENTIEVRSRSCWGDIDDFEFVNMQIRLGP
jgi:hypothetical protein